jgi:hypothetical protein
VLKVVSSYITKRKRLQPLDANSTLRDQPFVEPPAGPADVAPGAHAPVPPGHEQRPARPPVQDLGQEVDAGLGGRHRRGLSVGEHLVSPVSSSQPGTPTTPRQVVGLGSQDTGSVRRRGVRRRIDRGGGHGARSENTSHSRTLTSSPRTSTPSSRFNCSTSRQPSSMNNLGRLGGGQRESIKPKLFMEHYLTLLHLD